MKLKQLILSSIAVGALAFTFGVAQPAQAAIGMENPGPAMNLEKPASVTTQHHINVDGKVVEPINGEQNVIYVDGQPLVALRQVSEALGYKVAWDEPTKTALVDMNIATLAIQHHIRQGWPGFSCRNDEARQPSHLLRYQRGHQPGQAGDGLLRELHCPDGRNDRGELPLGGKRHD